MDQKDGFLRESPEECFQSALIEAIQQADRSATSTLIDTWAAEHGYEHVFIEIPEPVLSKTGEERESGRQRGSMAEHALPPRLSHLSSPYGDPAATARMDES